MIELRGLTKRYGETVAVDDLSCRIRPGQVTGFLGPNGAGKSTTMRMILGLDHPSAGEARVHGRRYHELDEPLRHVGALLEADAIHPGRSARSHLCAAARSNGIPTTQVDALLERVGLASVARRRAGTYSLGMRQRLGIAAALLGDPGVLLFDEPVNGLDVDGVRWVRQLVRDLAAEGRTVLLSSHLMSEMEQTADHLLVIGRGRLIADAPTSDVLAERAQAVRVRTAEAAALVDRLARAGAVAERMGDDLLVVTGTGPAEVGHVACDAGIALIELAAIQPTLEEAFLELTATSIQYGADDHPRQEDLR